MADSAFGLRARFRPLTPEQKRAVEATTHPLVTVSNPLDYHTFSWANEPEMTGTFTAMLKAGFDLSMLVLDFPRGDRCSDAYWAPSVRALETASRTTGANEVFSAPASLGATRLASPKPDGSGKPSWALELFGLPHAATASAAMIAIEEVFICLEVIVGLRA